MARETLIQLRRGSGAPPPSGFEVGEPAFDGSALYIKNDSGDMVNIGLQSFIDGAGRSYNIPYQGKFYFDTSNEWVCACGDIYGEPFGYCYEVGDVDNIDTASTFLVPANTKIKSLQFGGKYDGSDLDDIQIRIVKIAPSDPSCWKSGINSTCEATATIIYDDFFAEPSNNDDFTGTLTDYHYRKMDVDNLITVDSLISLQVKPVGTLAAPDDYYANWSFEMIGPLYS